MGNPLPRDSGRQGVRDPPPGNLVGGVVVWWGASGARVLNWRAASVPAYDGAGATFLAAPIL